MFACPTWTLCFPMFPMFSMFPAFSMFSNVPMFSNVFFLPQMHFVFPVPVFNSTNRPNKAGCWQQNLFSSVFFSVFGVKRIANYNINIWRAPIECISEQLSCELWFKILGTHRPSPTTLFASFKDFWMLSIAHWLMSVRKRFVSVKESMFFFWRKEIMLSLEFLPKDRFACGR